jgi:outer membrane protein TolC
MTKIARLIFILAILNLPKVNAAEMLTLDNYIKLIKEKNDSYFALTKKQDAALQESSKANLLTSPQYFANGDSSVDKSPTTNPAQNGTERKITNFQTGLEMQTEFGLSGKVYFGQTYYRVLGTNPIYVSPDLTSGVQQYYGTELKIPLLKNGFGRDVQAKKKAIEKSSLATQGLAKFKQLQLENQAKMLYLKVEQLQEVIQLKQTGIEQHAKLVKWVTERVHSKILEPSDLSQSIAAKQQKDLSLQSSLLELSQAKRDFNNLMNEPSEKPLPKLQSLDYLIPNSEIKINLDLQRKDIKSLEKSIEAEKETFISERENFKPELNIVGKALGYTNQSSLNDTSRCTSFENCANLYIGINFKVPLEFESLNNSYDSAGTKIQEKEFQLAAAKSQAKNDLNKIYQTSKILKLQRDLSVKIIATEKQRLEEEHKRQTYGRASAFDIIRAEQDYLQSQLTLLSIMYSQAELNTNLKLFEVTQ